MKATSVLPAAAVDAARIVDRVVLDHHDRHRRRFMLATQTGAAFLLDLAQTALLRHGDGLVLEDGGILLVEAAPEPVLEITAGSPVALARAAWHIGNRHTPVEVTMGAIYIAADHVLEDMLRGLGVEVRAMVCPFDPEPAAAHSHG